MQGYPCRVSNNPNPFLSLRRGFNHSPTLANLWQGLKQRNAETDVSLQCSSKPGRRLVVFKYIATSRDTKTLRGAGGFCSPEFCPFPEGEGLQGEVDPLQG